MAAAAAIAPVLAILGNFSQDPLPAVFVAVGGLVVLKFALGVSGRYEIWYLVMICISSYLTQLHFYVHIYLPTTTPT